MHFTLLLQLLLITTVSTSIFSSPYNNHDASQHPLEGIANLPPDPCIRPFSSPHYGRCPVRFHWCCFFVRGIVHCGCCRDFKLNHGSDTVGLSYTDITAQALAETQNVTTLEVHAEIQPGNNETLVRLFKFSCDRGRQHVACTQTACGFACGCHDNWNLADIGKDKFRDKTGDAEATTREVPEHKCTGISESEVDDEEIGRQEKHSDFSFQNFPIPHCIAPYYWRCCPDDCGYICGCGGYCV